MGKSCQAILPPPTARKNWGPGIGDWGKRWMLGSADFLDAACNCFVSRILWAATLKILWYANQPVKAVDVNSSG
jgi:hypothetical protein